MRMHGSWGDVAANWRAQPTPVRWGVVAAGAIVAILATWLVRLDASRVLVRAEVSRVARFASATGDAGVMATYQKALSDGVLTANEASAVIEAAKAAAPPYGLARGN